MRVIYSKSMGAPIDAKAAAVRGILGWVAATLVVYGIVLASQAAGEWVVDHTTYGAPLATALKVPFHLVMAPAIFALDFRWPRPGVTAVALLSFATWGALMAFAARALVRRRQRAS